MVLERNQGGIARRRKTSKIFGESSIPLSQFLVDNFSQVVKMGRKKVSIIESDEGLPEGFVTQNLLKEPDKEKCLISEADLEIIKKNHAFPPETVFFTHPDLTSECYSPEWVCFPEYPFVIGLKFPFPDLITRFFTSVKLNYAQMMPQGWRCLQALVRLKEKTGLNVGLEELAYTTDIRGFGLGRFCFRVKSGGDPILNSNNDLADRGWRNKFFFARKDSLGQEAGVILKWRSQEVAKLSVLFPEQEGIEENVKKIYELDPSVRSFKAFPVLFSAERVEGVEGEEGKPEESLSGSIKMSTATRSKTSVSAADLLAEAKAKRTAKRDSKPPTPKSMVSSSEVNASKKKDEAKKRKLVEAEATDACDDLNVEKTREQFGALMTDFVGKVSEIMSPIMDQVNTLKIKAARCSYEAEESKKLANISAGEVERLKKEAKAHAGEVDKLKKVIETLREELVVVCAEKVKENEAHLKELDAAKGDFKFNATKALLEARIQLMEEFKNGLAPSWDVEEEKRTLEDFIGEPADGEEVNSPALEALDKLVDDANKVLSTMGVTQVEENNQGKEIPVPPAAAGQDV